MTSIKLLHVLVLRGFAASESFWEQRNNSPAHQSRYYITHIGMFKMEKF